VLLHAAERQLELVGDGQVRATLGEPGEDVTFSIGESRESVVDGGTGEQLADDLGVKRRAALRNATDRIDEAVGRDDAVL
jgi:hypothetical protein